MNLIDPSGREIPVAPPAAPEPEAEPLVANPVLAEMVRRFTFEGANLWEERLRLVIKPPPKYLPGFVYAWAVRLLIQQEQTRKVFHENFTRRRRWSMFRPAR